MRERLLIRSAHKNLISATASPIPVASPSIIMAPITVENETTEEEEEEEVEEQQIIVVRSIGLSRMPPLTIRF